MAASSNKMGAHGENGASFEESFARLQEVVGRLSAGNLSLQEALGAFEEGMGLADTCAQMLDEAELRVKQVSDKALRAGSAALVDLDEISRGVRASRSDEPVILEIETYESTFVRGTPATDQGRESGAPTPIGDKGKGKSAQPRPQPLLDELDPLFDDE